MVTIYLKKTFEHLNSISSAKEYEADDLHVRRLLELLNVQIGGEACWGVRRWEGDLAIIVILVMI